MFLSRRTARWPAHAVFYPVDDESHDCFRFSEHALRKVLAMFSNVEVKHFGVREFPMGYFARAVK